MGSCKNRSSSGALAFVGVNALITVFSNLATLLPAA